MFRWNKDEYVLDVDDLIARLEDGKNNADRVHLNEKECQAVAVASRLEFAEGSVCISVEAPVKVVGDLHGQFLDLLRLFELCGRPPQERFLFLGDYVDRGRRSLEVIMLLLLYKVKYPDCVFMLRGNHECERISKVYGFRQEVKERFNSSKVWKSFLKTFQMMPMCAVVERSIFCCHGGLSPEMLLPKHKTLAAVFHDFMLPEEVASFGLLCDLVWADPMSIPKKGGVPLGWVTNKRGCSWQFGYDVIEDFLDKFNLDLIVRGHQVVEDGYEFYCDRSLVTLFSAPHYCGEFDNVGAIFVVGKCTNPGTEKSAIQGSFQILTADYTLQHQWIRNARIKKNSFF